MPPSKQPQPQKPIDQIVDEVGLYPLEAYDFVQRGLSFTVQQAHGHVKDPKANRHVDGRMLCEGLREFALSQWGLLARTVLRRWNVRNTEDFGRIVFAMVDNGYMQKTQDDTIEDFRHVYDFSSAFEDGYRIECKS